MSPLPSFDTIPVRVRGRGHWVSFALVAVLWFGGGGALTALAVASLSGAPLSPAVAWAIGATLVGLWLSFGAWLLLYGVFDAHRFAFGRDELRMRSWRGLRRLRWADVAAARLVAARDGVHLVLTFGPRTWVRIPILAYHGSARLLADLERRMPVAVSAPPRLQALLERADVP